MFRCFAAGLILAGLLHAQDSPPEALLQHAITLQQQGDLDEAVKAYRDFLVVRPNEAAVRSNLGVLLSRLGHFDEAIAEYKKAIDLEPASAGYRLNLGLAYYKSGRIPEAAKEFLKAKELAPDNLQTMLLLADCDLQMGQNDRVIALLKPVEDQNPNDPAIAYLLGTALIRDHQVEEGQKRVDRILRNGDSVEARFLLGSQMFAVGDFPAALKQFARTIELNPNLPGLQSFYGQALLNTGDPDAAAEAFRKELASNPNDYAANLYLAEILIARKRSSEALPHLARALQVRPDSVAAQRDLAAVRGENIEDAATADEQPGPRLGDLAPEFTVTTRESAERITLARLRNAGPVMLVFGSYTCPNFRAASAALNRLYTQYKDRVPFYLIYIREAHSTADWQSTRNEREGIALLPAKNRNEQEEHATLCVRKLGLNFPALLDDINGTAEKTYSAWPSRAYVIDRLGRIAFRTGLSELDFKPDQLEAAIRKASAPVEEMRSPTKAQ